MTWLDIVLICTASIGPIVGILMIVLLAMKWIVYEPRATSRVYLIADHEADFRLSRTIRDATRFATWKDADDARMRRLPRNGRVQGVEE